MKQSKLFIGLVIIAALFGGFLLGYGTKETSSDKDNNAGDISTKANINNSSAVSSDGRYIASWQNSSTQDNSDILLVDNATKTRNTIIIHSDPTEDGGMLWGRSGYRLFFSKNFKEGNGAATLFYIDLNAPDPTTVTEIVYSDPQRILANGITGIVGENGNILYVQNGNHIYALDINQGINAEPGLIADL